MASKIFALIFEPSGQIKDSSLDTFYGLPVSSPSELYLILQIPT